MESLIAAFDRIVESGVPELVLISGYSGIGKSAVVNELHKALVPARGLFASGKFDQYKRDIPYATLAQAFQGLIRPLLGLSDAVLAELARCAGRSAGPERQADGRSGSRIEADHRRTPACPRIAAAARTKPFPVGVSAVSRRLRPAGASAGAVP